MVWTSKRIRELEQFGTDVSRAASRLVVARESLEHGYLPEGLNDVNAEIEAVEEVGKQRAETAAWKLRLLMDQRPFMVEARKALSSLEEAHRNSFPGFARSGVGTDIARRLGDPAN